MSKESVILEAVTKAYEDESDRTDYLQEKADKLMTGIAAVTGYELFDVKTLLASKSAWVLGSCCLALGVLALSLFVVLETLVGRVYYRYPETGPNGKNQLVDLMEDQKVSQESAERALARVLVEARQHNAALNNTKGKRLSLGAWLLLAGFLLVVASRMLHATS